MPRFSAFKWALSPWVLASILAQAVPTQVSITVPLAISPPAESGISYETDDDSPISTKGLAKILEDKNSTLVAALKTHGVKNIHVSTDCSGKRYTDSGTEYVVETQDGHWSKSYLDPVMGERIRDELAQLKPVVSYSSDGVLTYCLPTITRSFRREVYHLKATDHQIETAQKDWNASHEASSTRDLLKRWSSDDTAAFEKMEVNAVETYTAPLEDYSFLADYFNRPDPPHILETKGGHS